MSGDIPLAILAQLDQEIAALDTCVDQLAHAADLMLLDIDRPQVIARLVLTLLAVSSAEKSAAIAAAAIVRLSEGRRGD